MKVPYWLSSGKNLKWLYYLDNYLYYYLAPKGLYRRKLERLRRGLSDRADYSYILDRLGYYNRMPVGELPDTCLSLGRHRPSKQKVYFFDSYRYTSLFPQSFMWSFLPGDITHVPDIPSIVKSRPLACDNSNSVLLKLDKIRHFTFVDDTRVWRDKEDKAIFRGKVLSKEVRRAFMGMYSEHPMIDAGDVSKDAPREWLSGKKSIREHLAYKFIMALEGNDVASNLKWVMSSRSIAVMPPPSCETWFMEGRLIPDVHYISILPDLSDLPERLMYYIEHPKEAKEIVRNANEYVSQFRDKEREDLISYLVLEEYFRRSMQL